MKSRMERRPVRMMLGPLAAGIVAAFWAGMLGGCGDPPRPRLAAIAPARPTPRPDPSPGFAEAELAGRMAAGAVPAQAKGKMRLSPPVRARISEALQPALLTLRRSLDMDFKFIYEPPQGVMSERQKGWTWLLKVQRWELEDAISREDWSSVAKRAGEALRMGARFAGGDASDVLMGAVACRWAMDSLIPHLKQFSPDDLMVLANQAEGALSDLAPSEEALANQLDTVMVRLQQLQDAYATGGREGMIEVIGKGARDSGRLLEGDPAQAPGFFIGLRDEALQLHAHYVSVATQPVSLRPAGNPFFHRDPMWLLPGEKKKYRSRPWRDLIPFLLLGHRAIAEELPFLETRLKLLAISVRSEQALAARGQAPEGLGAFAKDLRLDPYTGENLGYASAGAQYKVWSAGVDGVNDGGLTDLGSISRDMSLRTSSPR